VTLPLIEPVLILTIMFRTVDAFRKFESILVMTAGGPGEVTTTINFLAYNTGIFYLRFSDSAAMMVFMVIVMITISVLLIRLQRKVAE
jgi:multiple sugar transport system permease protein